MTADQWWALLFFGSIPIACVLLLVLDSAIDAVLAWIYEAPDALEDVPR